MKKLLPILALLAITFVANNAAARFSRFQVMEASFSTLSQRGLNQLIKVAAEEWDLSVGQARQAYNHGLLTITAYPIGGPDVYMLQYDGFCILAALEDKL